MRRPWDQFHPLVYSKQKHVHMFTKKNAYECSKWPIYISQKLETNQMHMSYGTA